MAAKLDKSISLFISSSSTTEIVVVRQKSYNASCRELSSRLAGKFLLLGSIDSIIETANDLVRREGRCDRQAGGPRWIQGGPKSNPESPHVMMGLAADPVEARFVESLAHPGGNVTGITNRSAIVASKRLELLKQAVP